MCDFILQVNLENITKLHGAGFIKQTISAQVTDTVMLPVIHVQTARGGGRSVSGETAILELHCVSNITLCSIMLPEMIS